MQDKWKPNQGNNENKCDDINLKIDRTEEISGCNVSEKPGKNTSGSTVPCPANANDEYAPTYRKSYFCVCAPKSQPNLKQSEMCACQSKSVPNLPSSCKQPSKHSGKSKDSSNWHSLGDEKCISKVVFCPSSKPSNFVCCKTQGGETCPLKAPMAAKKVSSGKVNQCVCRDEEHDFSIKDAKSCACASQGSSNCSVKKDQDKSCECAPIPSSKDIYQMKSCYCYPESDESDRCDGMPVTSKTSYKTALSAKTERCVCGTASKGMCVCPCSGKTGEDTDTNMDNCKTSESQYEDTQGVCGCTDLNDSREGAGLSTIFGSDYVDVEDKATSVYASAENSGRSGCSCNIQDEVPDQHVSSDICTSIKPQETNFYICKENGPHNASGAVCGAKSNSGRSKNRKSLQNSTRTSSRSQSVMAEITCLCTSTQRAKLGATNGTGPPFSRITESCCPCLGVVGDKSQSTKFLWKGEKFCECESGSNNSTTEITKKRRSKKSLFSSCSCCAKSDTSLPPTKGKSCPRPSKSLDEAPCYCSDEDDNKKKKSKKSGFICCCANTSNTSLPPITSKPCSCTSRATDEMPCTCSQGSDGPVPKQGDDEFDGSENCKCGSESKQSAQDLTCDDDKQVDSCIKCDAAKAAQDKPCCAKKRIMNILDMVSDAKGMKIDRVEVVHQIIQELSKMLHQEEATCTCMSYEECMEAVKAGRSPAQENKAEKEAMQTESKDRLDRLEKCLESCFPPKKGPKEIEIVAFEFDPDFKAKLAAAEAAEAAEAAAAAEAAKECLKTEPSCACNEDEGTVSEFIPEPEPEPVPEPEPEYHGECECEGVANIESGVYADCHCEECAEDAPNNQIVETTSSGNPQAGCQVDGNPLTDRENQLCEYLICRMCQICQGQAQDECNATDAQKGAHSGEGCLCCHCRAMICDNQCKTVAKILNPIVCNPVDEMVSLYIISLKIINVELFPSVLCRNISSIQLYAILKHCNM